MILTMANIDKSDLLSLVGQQLRFDRSDDVRCEVWEDKKVRLWHLSTFSFYDNM